jgi:hypothetical protein
MDILFDEFPELKEAFDLKEEFRNRVFNMMYPIPAYKTLELG